MKYQIFLKRFATMGGLLGLIAILASCAPERPSDVKANLLRTQAAGESADGERAGTSPAVAVIDSEILTLAEFERRISTLAAFAQARFSSVESKQDYLVDVVQFEVLADEAERRGYGKDALTVQAMKDVLAREVLENELRDRVQVGEEGENAVEPQSAGRGDEISASEERRLIVLTADSEEEAAGFRAQMESQSFQSTAERIQAFRILAHRYSTERLSADRGGDVGFIAAEDVTRKALSEEAFELEEIGDLSMPYQIDDGWQLAMLFEKRLVQTSALSEDEAQAQARRERFEQRREAAGAEFVSKLIRSADVEVFSKRVAELPLSPRRGMSTEVD